MSALINTVPGVEATGSSRSGSDGNVRPSLLLRDDPVASAPGTVAAVADLGGKARSLAALDRAGFRVPAWFVITPDAVRSGATSEIERELARLCPNGEPVAVRSSAVDEDGAEHSFAGQLESYLFVEPAYVADRVARVWRSAFSDRVRAYRAQSGLVAPPQPPAVIVQRMVNAEASGVAFGADPVTGRRGVAIVSAVRGLGTSLVSGECDADTFVVGRDGSIVDRNVAIKLTEHGRDASCLEGVGPRLVPPTLVDVAAIDDGRVREIAALVRRAGAVFGRPQDVEWAVEGGVLYVLQSRPITSLEGVADSDGAFGLWDNSNIAESYPGVTTPLTFSFARRAYEEVYRQFCRMMGVSAEVIAENGTTFRRMIGLVRGRIYYDLLNWHRVLAMLPGYNTNRAFMEQMMGVKEPLPEGVDLGVAPVGRARDAARLARTLVGLVANCALLERRKRAFAQRLDAALGAGHGPDLSIMRADELVAHYRSLEKQLLARWDAPLVNDFFAMIFYGVLRGLVRTWCGDTEGTLQNDLLCGGGGVISAEPAERVREMARVAASSPGLATVLTEGSPSEGEAAIRCVPELKRLYEEYLDRFGDRCLEELKLESPTLRDDPYVLVRSIGVLAGARIPDSGSRIPGPGVRTPAEERVRAALAKRPLRRAIFAWVLANARGRVRDRENLRFERTRVFGRVRSIFVELAKRLYAEGALADPRDVFYLEVDEVFGWVDGTTTCVNLGAIAAVRKAEFEDYREGEPSADRFETRGAVHAGNDFRGATDTPVAVESSSDDRRGLGCSPGVVRGRVRVVADPRTATVEPGEILVAERTDPGWVVLFASAAGLIVERGSLLSHAAIVAREMGIPAVTSISGLTKWLETGDVVEIDGATGVVKRAESGDWGVGYGEERLPSEEASASAPEASDLPTPHSPLPTSSPLIRYAQCWEDADVLLEALDVRPGDACLSIASAGDNTLALLARSPSRVVALDMNPAQLACVELRVAAYRVLEHHELLELVGSRPSRGREALYNRCRPLLSAEARNFWDARTGDIRRGIGAAGKFEKYFALFRSVVLPMIHSRPRVERMLRGGSPERRRDLYEREWNTRRWRVLFKVFFSRFVMARLGRDRRFFAFVEGDVSGRILERVRHALTALDPSENPYVHWILTGRHGKALPFALRPENFDAIRGNLDRLEIRCDTLEGFLASSDAGSFDRFNLSDVFEYVSEERYRALLTELTRVGRPGARLVYWNMLVPRHRPESMAASLRALPDLAARLHAWDKAFFYSDLVVEEVGSGEVRDGHSAR